MSTQVVTGSFINVASQPFFVPVKGYISEFRLKNLTQSNITVGSIAGVTTGTRIVEAFWCDYMNKGVAQVDQAGTYSGNVAPISRGNLPQNGFTIFNAQNPPVSAVFTLTAFTPGTTTVFTTSAPHGFVVGDNVRIWGMTSAPQFGGLLMTVTAVSSTTFTTLLDSTGATTSVGSVQRMGNASIMNSSLYYPQNRVIAKITNANPMVVTTLVQQNYFVGDVVTFDVPTVFGVPQLRNAISGLPFQATVIAANNAIGTQTVTLAIDSTNFGIFGTNGIVGGSNPTHWPLSPAYPFTFPYMVPQGEGNINNFFGPFNVVPAPLPYGNQDVLSFARQNQAFNGMLIGAGDGTSATTTGGLIGSSVDAWEFRVITSLQEYPQPLAIEYV
jgi:hypothetical protein